MNSGKKIIGLLLGCTQLQYHLIEIRVGRSFIFSHSGYFRWGYFKTKSVLLYKSRDSVLG